MGPKYVEERRAFNLNFKLRINNKGRKGQGGRAMESLGTGARRGTCWLAWSGLGAWLAKTAYTPCLSFDACALAAAR